MASIFKKDGYTTWSVIYYSKTEKYKNGKPKQKWINGLTYRQAQKEKNRIESEQLEGTFTEPSKVTTEEYLMEWLSFYKKCGNAISTCSMVEGIMLNHIIPEFGKRKLQSLTPKDMELFFLSLKTKHHCRSDYRYKNVPDDELPLLSPKTIRHIYIYFKMALDKAVEWNTLSKNPIIIPPPAVDEVEQPAWDEDTLLDALSDIGNPLLHLCLHLAFVGSMRSGEIAGLTWDKMDWENDFYRIDQIIQRAKKSALSNEYAKKPIFVFPNSIFTRKSEDIKSCLILKEPKTKKSKRTIYWTQQLKQELIARKQMVDRRKAILGDEYNDYNLVICLEDGRPVEPKLIAKWFKKFIERHGGVYPKVKLHSLRSTSTTYKLIVSHGDIKSVQGDTGHATAQVTMNTYAKIQDKERRKIAKALEDNFYSRSTSADNTSMAGPRTPEEANNLLLLKMLQDKASTDPTVLQQIALLLAQ